MLTMIGDYEAVRLEATSGRVRYAATHRVLPRRAIVEMLEAGAPLNAAVRLLRQACILEALQHSSVPRVFECGRIDGNPWIAYEARQGIGLDAEMAARALGVGEVMDLMEQVANVLSHAHSRGVLHRDITPHAILLETARGNAVVLYGWQSATIADSELPAPLRGTSPYRAPELIHDFPADGRADIYALGMIAIRALAGPDALIVSPANVHPPALATLLALMVHDDPLMRPTAVELVAAIDDIRDVIASVERENAALEVDLELAVEFETSAPPTETSDNDEPIVLLDQPRLKARWTPQWGFDKQPSAPHDVVQIEPRGRRSH